ncbi:MAG: hypothetical protein VKP72_05560 [bacterium]|nr:hypothetical protein [bacterium]
MSDISGIDPIKQTVKINAAAIAAAAASAQAVPGATEAPARDQVSIQTSDASDLGLGEAAGPGGQRGRILPEAAPADLMSAIGSAPVASAMPGMSAPGKSIEVPRPKPAPPIQSTPRSDVPSSVSYSSPSSVKPEPRYLDVQGCTGMGAASGKSYKVLESDAIAMYSLLKEKPLWKMDELKYALQAYFGIEAEVTKVDGRNAIVGTDGRIIAVDTEGNGAIDINDLQFGQALSAAGVDISQIKSASEMMKDRLNAMNLALKVSEDLQKMNQEIAEREMTMASIRASAEAADAKARGAAAAVAASGLTSVTPSSNPGSSSSSSSSSPSPGASSAGAAAAAAGASAAAAPSAPSGGGKGMA